VYSNLNLMNPEVALKFYKRLNLYFNLVIAIPLLVFGYFYLELEAGNRDPYLNQVAAQNLEYIFPFLIILLGGIGFLAPNERIKRIQYNLELKEKLNKYERIQLVRFGIYELAVWLSIAGLFLTGNKLYALFYVLVLILFSVDRPTARKIAKQLKLTREEENLFGSL